MNICSLCLIMIIWTKEAKVGCKVLMDNVNPIPGGRDCFHIHIEKMCNNNDVPTLTCSNLITLRYIVRLDCRGLTTHWSERGKRQEWPFNNKRNWQTVCVSVCMCAWLCLFCKWGLLPSVSRLALTVLYSWVTAERSGTCFDIFSLIH